MTMLTFKRLPRIYELGTAYAPARFRVVCEVDGTAFVRDIMWPEGSDPSLLLMELAEAFQKMSAEVAAHELRAPRD